MRIENIADVFDSDGEVIYQTVDVRRIVQELYAAANDVDFGRTPVTEASILGAVIGIQRPLSSQ